MNWQLFWHEVWSVLGNEMFEFFLVPFVGVLFAVVVSPGNRIGSKFDFWQRD